MRFATVLTALAFCGVLLASEEASAQMACADHGKITGNLKREFNESRKAMGLTMTGQLVEIFAGESGSWTILLVTPDGTACSLSAGENWVWVEKGPRPAALWAE